MPYTYKYLPAGSAIQVPPNQDLKNDFSQNLIEQFYQASDVYTIREEITLASGTYQDVDVRINQVQDNKTGEKRTDDWKKLLFKELDHSVDLGRHYQFQSNYWLTVNIEKINTLTQSATVRRCNNALRWQDGGGGIHVVPCVIDYLIKQNADYSTAGSAFVILNGMIEVFVQLNSDTNTLKPNQRFLFGNGNNGGNWTSYRIEGGGIRNYDNQQTLSNSSYGVLQLTMKADFANYDTDDVTNGIADVTQNSYALVVSPSSISGGVGQTIQLSDTVSLNGNVVTGIVTWSSSDSTKATVNSTGLVTLVSAGACTITATLENNTSVTGNCNTTITGTTPIDNYQIVFNPTTNYILEGFDKTWSVHLYNNGTQQSNVITFSLDANTVPDTKYVYTVLGSNSFKITNYGMYLTDTLDVTATSGSHSEIIRVLLKGAW